MQEVKQALADRGILLSSMGPKVLRFVTHLDVTDSQVSEACKALKEVQMLMLQGSAQSK